MGRKRTAAQEAQYQALRTLGEVPWHTLAVPDVFARLETSEAGLTDTEVARRTEKYGQNAMPSAPRPGLLSRIWDQVNNILIYILLAACIINAAFQDWLDFGLILGVVVLNVAIGVIQEGKAEAAAEALNSMLAAKAVVVRNGQQISIAAEDIVIGDIINISAGDAVAADVRLFRVANLKIRESALTGESEDVEKNLHLTREDIPLGDQKNRAFAGTFATSGQGMGVVVAIGATAQIGTIKSMLEEAEAGETPLQQQLEVFGKWLSILTLIVAIGTFFLAYYGRADRLPAGSPLAMSFSIAVSIAVAIIPEGLPSVVTITLALGVRSMADHNAIIRQLPAVETLGSVSVVCSDKTGTLTLNQMMVTRLRTAAAQYVVEGQGYDPYSGEVQGPQGAVRKVNADLLQRLNWLALPGVLANEGGLVAPSDAVATWPSRRGNSIAAAPEAVNVAQRAGSSEGTDSWQIAGDPTDVAVLVLGHKLGIDGNINTFKARYPVIGAIPFDSDYKFQAIMTDVDSPVGRKRIVYLKGAWDEVIRRCATQASGENAFSAEPCNQAFWLEQASTYAANGMRVLAIAQWEVPADKTTLTVEEVRDNMIDSPALQLNCLISILDPCRESAARAIHECHEAGIAVKMITGDHADTACYIARELGILDHAQFQHYLDVKDRDPEARRRIVLRGDEIKAIPAEPNETALAKYVMDVNVFARVAPEHKLRIVRALKDTHGRITAMTGDGVNDAPALKEAHVGVAMGITGTDVAKQAAKMILADDQFSTIAEAVRRGRGVYDNLKKVILFALPTNMAQGVSIVTALIIGLTTPLNAIQVLTVNMVTSVTLGIVIALEAPEANVMKRPPRDPKAALLDRNIAWRTFFVTVLFCIGVIGNMEWEVSAGASLYTARATAMTTLVTAQCLYGLNCRFGDSSLKMEIFYGNHWIFGAIFVNMLIQILLIYVPGLNTAWGMADMNGVAWGKVLLLSFVIFFMIEALKEVEPYLIPYATPVADAIGGSIANALRSCTCGFCCRIPAPPASSLGLPAASNSSKVVSVSPTTASGAAATGVDKDAASNHDDRMLIARVAGSHRHIKAPPVPPEVSNSIAAAKRASQSDVVTEMAATSTNGASAPPVGDPAPDETTEVTVVPTARLL